MIPQNFDSLIIVNVSHDSDNQTQLLLEGSGIEPDENTIRGFILSLRGFLVDFGNNCEQLTRGVLRLPINSEETPEVTIEKMELTSIADDIEASLQHLPDDHVKLLYWKVGEWTSLVLLLFRFDNTIALEPIKNLLKWGEYKNFIRTERFTQKFMKKMSCDAQCPICLEEIKRGGRCAVYPCGHCFHASCSRKWLCKEALHPTCPLCRKDVRVKTKQLD